VRAVAAGIVVALTMALTPGFALARAEGGSETDDDRDTVTNHITVDGEGEDSGPRQRGSGRGSRGRYQYETEIVEGAGRGCPDGTLERRWRVDRLTGERTLVYGGCVRARATPTGDDRSSSGPPSSASVSETLPIPAGTITTDPSTAGLTGLGSRLSHSGPTTFGPFTTTLDGYEITARLTVTDYRWDTGDGGTGSGPSITHTYERKGEWRITLTLTWTGSYTFTGPDGELGSGALSLTTTTTRDYLVDEVQAVGDG
jgi:hypothetical protein